MSTVLISELILKGVITCLIKMCFDILKSSLVPKADEIAEIEKQGLPPTIEALLDVNASQNAELEFQRLQVQELRETIIRVRSRLPDTENTELP